MTDRATMLQWATASGVVGGILILLGGAMMALMGPFWGMGWMMGGYGPYAGPVAGAYGGWFFGLGLWGVVLGAVAIVAAVRVEADPRLAGIALVVAGVLSLPAMGGFLLGAFSALLGGVLALMAGPAPAPAAAPPLTPTGAPKP